MACSTFGLQNWYCHATLRFAMELELWLLPDTCIVATSAFSLVRSQSLQPPLPAV